MKMGKINRYLKGLFISFNALFAILGCLLISEATKYRAKLHLLSAVSTPELIWLFAIGILSISCLGIYAGFTEKEIILKIFAGFMVAGMIIVLIFGINVVVRRNKVKSSIDSTESFMKNEELRTLLNEELQQGARCCGVVSASDWGDNIPNSCECYGGRYREYEESECTSKPWEIRGPHKIYAQPCKNILMSIDLVFRIAIGLYFGFAVTALLGLLLSLLMIHQVRHQDGSTSIAMKGY